MTFRTIFMTAAAVAALATPAAAQVVRPKVTLAQAVATAERELGARAYDAEFDMDLGDMVYEIDLVKDGKPIEAKVDATSGRIIRQTSPIKARLPLVNEHLKVAQTAPRPLSQTITMVEDAAKNPMTRMAATGTHTGARETSASTAIVEMVASVPQTAIHLRVSRRRSSGPKMTMPKTRFT